MIKKKKRNSWFIFLLIVIAWTGCRENPRPVKTMGKGGETIYSNQTSLQTELQLPDGTKLMMDSATIIRLRAGFNQGNRDLYLEGEAIFRVDPSGVKPFVVHTRALLTAVLDTSPAIFKIYGYPASPGEEVDLFAGNLKVTKSYHSETDNEPVILRAGEMAMVNTDIDLMEKEKLDSAELRSGMLSPKGICSPVFGGTNKD
ncbi:MAG TPA: FecR domain-containing protein [Puia sp.]